MRIGARSRLGAKDLRLVATETECVFCHESLAICETRERYVQCLPGLYHVVGKGKKCVSSACDHGRLRYRSPEVGRLVLRGHEFGRDIVLWSGDQHLREKVSIPRIHRRLVAEYGVPICERSVGNLVDDYLALCQCVAGDSERVREKLKRQGAIVLCVDGVHFDAGSPELYVQREAISGEVLYAERRLAKGKDDLVPMLRRTAALAKDVGVAIIGIVSDKERSLVPAIAEVFPDVLHQFCQTHFLSRLAEPLKEDDQELAAAAKETVLALRGVQRTIERQFPTVAVGGGAALAKPVAVEQGPGQAPADAAALQEAKLAAALARAGTVVGMVYGRPITDPPGLKRIRRLQRVQAAVEHAARKKPAPEGGWSLIERLRGAFAPLKPLVPVANRLERHLTIVRDVAHVLETGRLRRQAGADDNQPKKARPAKGPTPEAPALKPPGPSAAKVKRVLRRYLNRLQKQAPRRGRGAETGHFIDRMARISDRYWSGLFHAYDHAEIPRTSNGIEGFFGSSKRSLRSVTGCSSTAGGKMQSSGEFAISGQALVGTLAKAELEEQLKSVPDAAYLAAKRLIRQLQEPARERRSVQRRPEAFLAHALDEWLGDKSKRGP
jgi:hypothetical protein